MLEAVAFGVIGIAGAASAAVLWFTGTRPRFWHWNVPAPGREVDPVELPQQDQPIPWI
jgi:hypothetical protein